MTLLQPFGVDRIESYKYPIIMGYGILTAISYILAELFLIYILRYSRNLPSLMRLITVNILISIIMGFLISCYSSWTITGSLYRGWHDDNDQFTLHSLWINSFYAAIIGSFISVYMFLRDRNRLLHNRLKEEIEMNRILIERNATKDNDAEKIKYDSEPTVSLKGSTKESVCLKPSSLLFMESEGNYVNIYFNDNGMNMKKTLRSTLKQMEDYFVDYPNILRCHRAFIVNIDKVRKVEGNASGYKLILVNTDYSVIVSRAYASAVYELIEG